jgi:hypothetical protein
MPLAWSILSSALKIAAWVIGDAMVVKWLSYAKSWYFTQVDASIKARVDSQYVRLLAEAESLRQDRHPGPPTP